MHSLFILVYLMVSIFISSLSYASDDNRPYESKKNLCRNVITFLPHKQSKDRADAELKDAIELNKLREDDKRAEFAAKLMAMSSEKHKKLESISREVFEKEFQMSDLSKNGQTHFLKEPDLIAAKVIEILIRYSKELDIHADVLYLEAIKNDFIRLFVDFYEKNMSRGLMYDNLKIIEVENFFEQFINFYRTKGELFDVNETFEQSSDRIQTSISNMRYEEVSVHNNLPVVFKELVVLIESNLNI